MSSCVVCIPQGISDHKEPIGTEERIHLQQAGVEVLACVLAVSLEHPDSVIELDPVYFQRLEQVAEIDFTRVLHKRSKAPARVPV